VSPGVKNAATSSMSASVTGKYSTVVFQSLKNATLATKSQ
jgi:hypothetical protein